MTVKGGTSQACAACKYQRRRCTPDCAIARFFPHDQPKMFQNAHRLYGVRNILHILKQLDPDQKFEAMKSIIFQSNMREKFPVYGCVGIIAHLQQEICQVQLELEAVTTQLNVYRQQQHHHQLNHIPIPSPQSHYLTSSQVQLGANSKNVLPLLDPQQFDSMPVGKSLAYHDSFSSANSSVCNDNYIDSKGNSLWLQYNNNSNNVVTIQPQAFASQAFQLQQQAEVFQDYDEISPAFFDIIDDRQSHIDSKEYESSSESSARDTKSSIEHLEENELKDAAAHFSLTSIN